MEKQRITVAAGDGIGPELLRAVLHVFEGANVPLDYDVVEVGEQVYRKALPPAFRWTPGMSSGVTR